MATVLQEGSKVITTGADEMDKKLGGGIPLGSLTLIEGQSDAGKSVLSQHFASGSLQAGLQVGYYTTENSVKSLLNQMRSLGLDVMDHFLVDRMRIYPLTLPTNEINADLAYQALLKHIEHLPERIGAVIVDSLTTLVGHSSVSSIIDYFSAAKRVCESGRTVILVVHTSAFDEKTLIRVRSLCDAHLRLRLEQVGEQLIKVLEVAKVRNAERTTGNIVSFDVEPGLGMHIIPVSKAKA